MHWGGLSAERKKSRKMVKLVEDSVEGIKRRFCALNEDKKNRHGFSVHVAQKEIVTV